VTAPAEPTPAPAADLPGEGVEWCVDATGADPARLADVDAVAALLGALVRDLALTAVGEARWHRFPAPGGVTGLVLLAESHLAVHTFPEHGALCLNLFCCRPRARWDFAGGLARHVGATAVTVREVRRRYAPPALVPA
jgi:S-adenosylmethionine decarboxylase